MHGLSGQVLRCGGWLLRLALALILVLGLGLGALSWRLAQGPLHLPMLAHALERFAPELGLGDHLSVGDAAIAWAGFHDGHHSPLELRLSGVQLRDDSGAIRQELPDASVTLSLGGLLRGQFAPFRVALQSPTVVLERAADGGISLAMGRAQAGNPLVEPEQRGGGDILRQIFGSEAHGTPLSTLRQVDLVEGRLTILDRQLGLAWRLEEIDISLLRTARGAVQADGTATLMLPDHGAGMPVRISGRAEGDGPVLEGRLSLPALEPARIAALMPALAPLALFDAPVSLNLSGRFDGGQPTAEPQLHLQLEAGAGSFTDRGRKLAFAGLRLDATGTPTALTLNALRLALPAVDRRPGQPQSRPPVIDATGQALLRDSRWRARLNLKLDQLAAADIGAYWPPDLVRGARGWIVENLTGGTLRDGTFTLHAESGADLSGLAVTQLDGTLRAEQATVHWLRPIPPLEGVNATASFTLKEISIAATSARQSGTALTSPGATIRFLNLDGDNEQAEIEAKLRGPVPDAIALIRHPRLKLFEKRPLDLKDPGGQVEGTLRLGFPLLEDIPAEVLRVNAQLRVTQMRLADVVMGKRLERGTADLTVDNGHLTATGDALLAGVPTQISVNMDFRPGPATQVVERYRAEARPDAGKIAEFGLDLDGFVEGPVAVKALMERRRSGETRVNLTGDLRDSRMTLSPFAWEKRPGQPASAQGVLRVVGDSLRSVESFQVEAPALAARGQASFSQGSQLDRVDVADARVFGGRFTVEARPPAQALGPWRFRLSGPVLDLGPALAEMDQGGDGGGDSTPVMVEGQFDRVILGEGRFISGVQGRAAADVRGVLREARIAGDVGPGGAFDLTIVPAGGGRNLTLNAANAGNLLRAFDILRQVEGGRLVVHARWPSNAPGAVLTGTAEMSDFAFHQVAGIGKLLQALTVYGVFDAVRGSGLSFSRMVAPFSLSPQVLSFRDARAFSASLGVTAKGSIQRRQGYVDLEGTIVPAYVLNSLLGQIPLLGRLFSPERGGGLFAATWQMRGPVQDPAVSVNPLAALTPGFLRGIFGGGAEAPRAAP